MAEALTPARRTPALEAWGVTDPGLVRRNNEDSWFLDQDLRLAIVADGMGGASCGEVASAMAVEAVSAFVRRRPCCSSPEQLLTDAIVEANRAVFDRARRDPACAGMGSTIVVALWELPTLTIANVGDSRAYLWRGGALTQMSYDQTLVNDLRVRFGLSEQEVSNFPHKNVLTMAVGTSETVVVRIHHETLQPGDEVLLCSDGLSGPVCDASIAEALRAAAPVDQQVMKLVGRAKAAGAPDNVTAVLLRYA